jgi:hypothetical protein
MATVKVYRYKTMYNSKSDDEPISKRMGTRKFIEGVKGTVLEETELEVEASKVDGQGKTEVGFKE